MLYIAYAATSLASMVGLALLASCASGGAPAGSPPPTVARYEATGEGGEEALLQGRLVLRDGCVHVEAQQDGGGLWLPTFADSVRASDDGLTYGGQTLALDSTVALTGGESELLDIDTVPAACDTDVPVWRVAQPAG